MVHSRLPLPSLLCLFSALLMLIPELLMGNNEGLSGVTYVKEQDALAFAVEEYNQDADTTTNYFKVLRVLKTTIFGRKVFDFTVDLVETTCTKSAGRRMIYKEIRKCQPLPGNQKPTRCHFIVGPRPPLYEMKLRWSKCP